MDQDLFGICPYATVRRLLAGKWALLILYYLSMKAVRSDELQWALSRLTQATLTKQLHTTLEDDPIEHTVYNQIPPKTEHSLSQLDRDLELVLDAVGAWGKEYTVCIKEKEPQ